MNGIGIEPDMVTVLEGKGIGLKSLHKSIDTTSSAGKRIFYIFGALAEFERTLIRERAQAGLQAARARGRTGGRPKALATDQQALAVTLYAEKQYTLAQICQLLGFPNPPGTSILQRGRKWVQARRDRGDKRNARVAAAWSRMVSEDETRHGSTWH